MYSDKRVSLTILHLANTRLEVIQGHVADLVFEVGEIHGEGWSVVTRRKMRFEEGGGEKAQAIASQAQEEQSQIP